MEQRLPEFWKGIVRIRIKGEQTERFLNLCINKGICIRNICRRGEEIIEGTICAGDFLRIGSVRRKTGVKIHILWKKGLPFLMFRSSRRKLFCLGVLICIGILWFLSSRIWNIHIEGNVRNSTGEILSFLEEKGIVHGMPGSKIDCNQVASEIREKYPDIAWVSVKLEGSRLLVQVQEGVFLKQQKDQRSESCDLRADQEGIIVKIITRAGVPKVSPGDKCSLGDILISGCLEIRNDSQEVIRREYVHADGDIYIRRRVAYYREIPLEYQKEVPDGKIKKGVSLRIGAWNLEMATKTQKNWHKVTETVPLHITESFELPVSIGRITQYHYRQEKAAYSPKEAKSRSLQELYHYEQKLMEKGVQISANNVKIDVDHKTCISKGSLEIIQKTGTETPVEKEVPAERTAEDD